jgi:hypothetical protein
MSKRRSDHTPPQSDAEPNKALKIPSSTLRADQVPCQMDFDGEDWPAAQEPTRAPFEGYPTLCQVDTIEDE